MLLSLPKAAEPLLCRFSIAFTRPTFQRAMVLFIGVVLTMGRRTVTRTLWTARTLCRGRGHFSDYHRVLCRARWSLWPLATLMVLRGVLGIIGDVLQVASGESGPVTHTALWDLVLWAPLFLIWGLLWAATAVTYTRRARTPRHRVA